MKKDEENRGFAAEITAQALGGSQAGALRQSVHVCFSQDESEEITLRCRLGLQIVKEEAKKLKSSRFHGRRRLKRRRSLAETSERSSEGSGLAY